MTSNKVKKIRLDIYLVENLYFTSREKARIAIMEGKIYVNNQKEDKPGTLIKEDANVEFRGEKLKYVSRGGLKLEKAINVFNINLKDKVSIDIGASTGGFTDVMLQNGAKKVYAIDCGTNQLDYKLRVDNRVVSLENTNARYLSKESVNNEKIDIITIDVSFISLTKIIPVAKDLLNDDGEMIMLIKPQFEAGKELIQKGGVVRDKNVHINIIEKICECCLSNGLEVKGIDYSPIKGPAGNIEYLIYVEKNDKEYSIDSLLNIISLTVDNAHKDLKSEV